MSRSVFYEELAKLESYLKSDANEDAKRPLLYPLFQKLFKEKFKIESAAAGADVYIEGQLIVESKTSASQWLEGFYQALHYTRKFGLAYNTIMVIAHNFCGVWRIEKIPEYAVILSKTSDAHKAPSAIGKENARKTAAVYQKEIQAAAMYWLTPADFKQGAFMGGRAYTTESHEILKLLRNLDSDRRQVNKHNFIQVIERLKQFFEHPIDAVHAFYTMVPYWDVTSRVSEGAHGEIRISGFSGTRSSDEIAIQPRHLAEFRRFVETQYIFTNEGSGLTVDYYFSRFDEVLALIDPEYVKQHGIFFTDANLSRFALWFAKHHFPGNINEDYIVFDPAGGSGNLVSSWRGKLKHKVVSELQPDLLRIIERRMQADPFHLDTGFTIIPKTADGVGLNFLDRPADEYMSAITAELSRKNIAIDKPLAFLLNPPYKNTDENVKSREAKEAHYRIDPSILELTGDDAGKERYLGFLGQILNICRWQDAQNHALKPVVMVFTPTSWLIPRPTYAAFREHWDAHFKFHSGFIIRSNEFFKLDGKWPLAFTIWIYDDEDPDRENKVKVFDLTGLKRADLDIEWMADDDIVSKSANNILKGRTPVLLDNSRGDIRSLLPTILRSSELISQPRYNFYRNKTKEEQKLRIVSGFPSTDDRHIRVKAPHGFLDGNYVGFMDDGTPVRLRQEPCNRLSNLPDRVWFRLDTDIKAVNKSKCFNGPPDNRGYCGYNVESAKATFTWFCITKAINGVYPLWSNQFDLWPPNFKPELAGYWHSLCFAFVLAENRCIVTKFEADNPVEGAPEIFVDNPLCPTNRNAFWCTTLEKEIVKQPDTAIKLVEAVKELYRYWNHTYCKGNFMEYVGLQDEPYFKYFSYPDFLTPHSGLIQIRKYAEIHQLTDLFERFEEISRNVKLVKAELYRLLVEEFKYFD